MVRDLADKLCVELRIELGLPQLPPVNHLGSGRDHGPTRKAISVSFTRRVDFQAVVNAGANHWAVDN